MRNVLDKDAYPSVLSFHFCREFSTSDALRQVKIGKRIEKRKGTCVVSWIAAAGFRIVMRVDSLSVSNPKRRVARYLLGWQNDMIHTKRQSTQTMLEVRLIRNVLRVEDGNGISRCYCILCSALV